VLEKLLFSVLRHCWLGDRKGIQPLESWLSACWWWQFEWSFACLLTPVVTTTSITLSYNRIQKGGTLVRAYPSCPGKWPFSEFVVGGDWKS